MDVRTNQFLVWDPQIDEFTDTNSLTYSVERFDGTGEVELFITSEPSISILELFKGLATGDSRFVRVRAIDSSGPGLFSEALKLTLIGLAAPQNLRIK